MQTHTVPDELPVGLLERLGQNTRAMEGFFSLTEPERQQILAAITGAKTGTDAKARVENAVASLEKLGSAEWSTLDHKQ